MARTRDGGGSTASAVALTIFGLGFGVCLVLAILFYTQKRSAEEAAADAQRDFQRYAEGEDQTRVQNLGLLQNPDQTVVGQLLNSNQSLRNLITAQSSGSLAEVRDAVEQVRDRWNNDDNPDTNIDKMALTAAINDLAQTIVDQKARIAELQQQRDEAQEARDAAQQRVAEVRSSFEAQQQTLQTRLQETKDELTAYQKQIDQIQQSMTQRVQQVHTQHEDKIADLEETIRQKNREIASLQSTLTDLKKKYQSIDAPNVVRPDGQIVSVMEGEEQVYVNLGREDRVVRAMTFEVFAPDTLVKPDQYDEVRGKATIELVEVDDTRSLARIVRRDSDRRGSVVSEGDEIVNLAYQPNATYTFYVHGKFNMDESGDATAAEAQHIKSIIKEWGGRVTENLDYEVDYVIIGSEPERPDPLPESVIDPVRIKQHNAQQEEFRRYNEVIAEANQKNIPIVNQNRFLALVGYYER